MNWLDRWVGGRTRNLARQSSRRSFFGRFGTLLVGGAALPLLPVARGHAEPPGQPPQPQETGDPNSCEYWRHCAIDGFLCGCCGGAVNSCPPGTEPSPVSWIGTCRNPVDGLDYIISYNDCCGKNSCGRCLCNRNESDRPVYMPSKSNDINWCHGTSNNIYHCSTAIVLGVAVE
ncbi:MAG: methylamine dehydrogenase light chain [Pseudomonadales bacterium]